MTSRTFAAFSVVLACAWMPMSVGASGIVEQASALVDEDLKAFDAAVARYVALRTTLEYALPSFDDPRRDPWTLVLMRRYLASAIRTARRDAQEGCIFAPAAGVFRETIGRAASDPDTEAPDDELGEDGFVVDLALNEPVPRWALSAVPAALIERFPPLPATIEYRRAGGTLILWDARAEILVDALPDAFVGR